MDPCGRTPRSTKHHVAVGLCALALACGQGTPPTTTAAPVAPSLTEPIVETSTFSADWPTYGHDANRTGFNAGETTLSPGNVAQLAAAWQADIGMGGAPTSGTPTVAQGRVFVGSSVTTGPDFFAFDAATGGLVWSANLNYVENCELVGIGSTSATDGTVVVVGGADGAYYGLDFATGTILWRHAVDDGPSEFAWSSPLLVNGRAYIGIASGCDLPPVRGELRALDVHSGALLADQFFVPPGRIGAGVWNSPTLGPLGSNLFVATGEDDGTHGSDEQAIVSLDPETLAIQSAFKEGQVGQDLDFASSPVVFHDRSGRSLVGANHKNGTFYAFATSSVGAGPVWQRPVGAVIGMMPAYDPSFGDGGTLFVVGTDDSSNPDLHACDPATGQDRWVRENIGQVAGNMAIANDMIFLNTGPSGLTILDETNGTTLKTLIPPGAGATYTGVAVTGGTVYWLSGRFLNAWRLPGGAPSRSSAR
jgi:outer membrane protein assembly factor BamB